MTTIFVLSCLIPLVIGMPMNLIVGSPGSNDANISMLQFVTTVEGKSYFQDQALRDWNKSVTYCESLGMRLGSIETTGQFDALNRAHSKDNLYGDFWISGRDSMKLTQFVWNVIESEVPLNIPYVQNKVDFPYQTCLRFSSQPNNGSHLYPRQCTIEITGVICETF